MAKAKYVNTNGIFRRTRIQRELTVIQRNSRSGFASPKVGCNLAASE